MIVCVGTTPAVQRVMVLRRLTLDAVNRAVTTLDGAAGKSINVAKVLQALDEPCFATGFMGGDRGDFVHQVLSGKLVPHEFVQVAGRTRECITVIDQSNGTYTELVEEASPASPADFEALLDIVRRQLAACRAVVMSGTVASGGPADFYLQLTRLARQAGALAVVDAQGAALTTALPGNPDLVKPNRAELAASLGRALQDQEDTLAAMRELHARGARRIVVTAGRERVLAFDGREFWTILPPAIAPANPIGSGDAFTAALTARLVRGDDLGEACRWGAAAGAANALTLLPGELNRQDVPQLAQRTEVHLIRAA